MLNLALLSDAASAVKFLTTSKGKTNKQNQQKRRDYMIGDVTEKALELWEQIEKHMTYSDRRVRETAQQS